MKKHLRIGLKSLVKTSLLAIGLCVSLVSYSQDTTSAAAGGGATSDAATAGKAIFEGNCATCHKFGAESTGPALSGVVKRQGAAWITTWIDNPAKVIASGDKHAVEMKAKYGSVMPSLGLSKEEINSVIEYLKVGTDAVAAPAQDTGDSVNTTVPESGGAGSGTVNTILIVVLVVLLLIVGILVLLSATISKTLKVKEEAGELDEADAEFINQKHDLMSVIKNKTFIGIALGITLLLGAYFGITKGLYSVGVQQGYAPTQPIAFSHKLHAGDKQIACEYCHTSVRKAKHANIPSASICMNCHIKIKTESEQIAQIYEAIDYDPKAKIFGKNIKPIQWVRVHNLPDHVYFNHSQHVELAGIECEECHGPIKEMSKVYQYSPLTMGWCIDCHRKTEVKHATDNEYYDRLIKAHEAKGGDATKMTVEDIGGTECGRCHY
jgi:mono/diheme cytochrome c family protein